MDTFKLPYEAPPTVLKGPGGIKLVLDVREVFPDDPGNGTPALVTYGTSFSASYECATNEEELTSDRHGTKGLTHEQLMWLDAQQQYVDEVWRQGKERDAIRKMRKEQAR